jgi:hypothetical protein
MDVTGLPFLNAVRSSLTAAFISLSTIATATA